ncbi:uncharacterized protein LOC131077785 [Cryptomeria japonica]|uniref:uncharacterized protein LOC131077785 n=1 Tax=Cryptomeria japonica TaxID=3369 RepID=UPI0025AB8C91|nr:uncharacterized protein LOC131077785 [Cryptomeria japonica]XP_057871316.1 uncharacterized protein LOC131077785 [Cryptomeria japonica]XP_057871317.1 uncharacterized protein LOC131077785 [Cryptomeria japonica]
MSGAAKVRATLNIADSEGRPVLRPAAGNNTPSSPGEGVPAKPTSKPTAKQHPSKNPKTPPSDNEAKPASPSPKIISPTLPATASKSLPLTNESKTNACGKVPLRNGVSKSVAGVKSPRLNCSFDSGIKPSSFKGGSISFSLTASSCSSSEGSSDSSCSLAAMKKAASVELYAQRKLKIAQYGRKQGSPKPVKVAPDDISMSPPPEEAKKRCGWITSQSDPAYVAFHDEEWGIPVHDDKKLFELLVLSGALAELSWPAILSKRDNYREMFSGFDPVAVAKYDEKKIKSLKSICNIMLNEGKLRGIVDNAKNFLKIIEECGSFDNYCWGFVNHKPVVNKYRYPRQVPVKIPKSEVISKDLVKRGFRFVGPTIMYSFMQVTGMTNDHLVNCFRHEECNMPSNEQQSGYHKKDYVDDTSKKEVERLVIAIENSTPFQDCNEVA